MLEKRFMNINAEMVSRRVTGYKNKEKMKERIINYLYFVQREINESNKKHKGQEKINFQHWHVSQIVVAYVQ
jgi:hypothetical protein